MLLLVALVMIAIAVYFMYIEFLNLVRGLSAVKPKMSESRFTLINSIQNSLYKIEYVMDLVVAFFIHGRGFIIDILSTVLITGLFGIGGGITAACTGLFASNIISFLIWWHGKKGLSKTFGIN